MTVTQLSGTMTLVNPTASDVGREPWVSALRADGPEYDGAVRELHETLLRAARHQVWRLRGSLPGAGATELEDLAQQAADDALVDVLRKLDTFEGRSRFTTWAWKFGVFHAGNRVRKEAWRGREVALTDTLPTSDHDHNPESHAVGADLAAAISRAFDDLTPHQRRVAVALLVDEVPIDVLAERLESNRNALYKTLHDARRRLRASLVETGHVDPTGSTP